MNMITLLALAALMVALLIVYVTTEPFLRFDKWLTPSVIIIYNFLNVLFVIAAQYSFWWLLIPLVFSCHYVYLFLEDQKMLKKIIEEIAAKKIHEDNI